MVTPKRARPRGHVLNRATGGALCARTNPSRLLTEADIANADCKLCCAALRQFEDGLETALQVLGI